MEIILTLVFLFGIFVIPIMLTDHKFSNSLPPEGYQTDWAAMNNDFANGKSKTDVMRKSNNGGYYVKKK